MVSDEGEGEGRRILLETGGGCCCFFIRHFIKKMYFDRNKATDASENQHGRRKEGEVEMSLEEKKSVHI